MKRYIAFLCGINISVKNKVPMTEMKKELEKLEFEKAYSKIGEPKEELERFLISYGNNMKVCYT